MEQLVDIRDIKMDEILDRKQRMDYLNEISNNGYVKYDNVRIKLEFVQIYPDDYKDKNNVH